MRTGALNSPLHSKRRAALPLPIFQQKSTHILPETLTVSSVLQKLTFPLLETFYCMQLLLNYANRATQKSLFFNFYPTKSSFTYENPYQEIQFQTNNTGKNWKPPCTIFSFNFDYSRLFLHKYLSSISPIFFAQNYKHLIYSAVQRP